MAGRVANARMYSVTPEAAELWHRLLVTLIAEAGVDVSVIEHPAPAPLEDLWRRDDLAGVFMCGLPLARALRAPAILAAPVPAPAEFRDEPRYWSDLVVRADSGLHMLSDTFGRRIAMTVPTSQSGFAAALALLESTAHHGPGSVKPAPGVLRDGEPLYAEVIAPTITPLGALQAVINQSADVAPIDAYALRLLEAFRPDLTAQIRVVASTRPTPIPPLVASTACEPLEEVLLRAHENPTTARLMERLLVRRFVKPDPASYGVLRKAADQSLRFWNHHALATVIHPAFAAEFAGHPRDEVPVSE